MKNYDVFYFIVEKLFLSIKIKEVDISLTLILIILHTIILNIIETFYVFYKLYLFY